MILSDPDVVNLVPLESTSSQHKLLLISFAYWTNSNHSINIGLNLHLQGFESSLCPLIWHDVNVMGKLMRSQNASCVGLK